MPFHRATINKHHINFECPCGYTYEQSTKDERRLKMVAKLHKKICSMCGYTGEIDYAHDLNGKSLNK